MDWSTTYVLGGGPSAANFDVSRVRGRGVVLGINDAAFHKPCDAFFSNDHGYAVGIRDKILAFAGERHLSVRLHWIHLFRKWPATVWERLFEDGPTFRPGKLASGRPRVPGCSGYVALNLAAQKGAKRIVLIGFDFADVYTYFFDNKPFPRKDVPGVRASFSAIAPKYKALGIQIENASPGTSLTAFCVISHDDVYARA